MKNKVVFTFFFIFFIKIIFANKEDTTYIFYYKNLKVPVSIKFSKDAKATILALPGWNLKSTDWCTKTKLCEKAKNKNFNVIMVEMQKSVYLKEYYPQTRQDYKKYPTRTWLHNDVILFLIQKKIIDEKEPIFALGLSTGARGAAILALEFPQIIKAAACLSGDYNPLLQKNDLLMINSLGSFDKYQDFWSADNNIELRVNELITPLYIGHGKFDKISPILQSQSFIKAIKSKKPNLRITEHFAEKMGHDYIYWNSEIDLVIKFFEEILISSN
jgi:S-formylglutathione hydrolase FrmB